VISSIGRLPHNLVPFDDPSVSGEHAEITFVRDRWWVRDLGSTNGTLVNEERIDGPTPLRSGDVVQFGRVSGRFRA
jgi:pSer/pThr/pTyr-binding forkhead associated (FHA) protein